MASKNHKKLKDLRQVLSVRLAKLKILIKEEMCQRSQGYIAGQREAYEDIIDIIDDKVLVLYPRPISKKSKSHGIKSQAKEKPRS